MTCKTAAALILALAAMASCAAAQNPQICILGYAEKLEQTCQKEVMEGSSIWTELNDSNATADKEAVDCFKDIQKCSEDQAKLISAILTVAPLVEKSHIEEQMCIDGCFKIVLEVAAKCVPWDEIEEEAHISKDAILNYLKFICVKDTDGELCSTVFTAAAKKGIYNITELENKCKELEQGVCTPTCSSAVQAVNDATGCCFQSFVSLLDPIAAESPLKPTDLLKMCGVQPEALCPNMPSSSKGLTSSQLYMYVAIGAAAFVVLLVVSVMMYRRAYLDKHGWDMINCFSGASGVKYQPVPQFG